MQPIDPELEDRVLVLAPSGRDATVLCDVLNDAGVPTAGCESAAELCHQIGEGAAAAIIADEALTNDAVGLLVTMLGRQPEWSDFPLIMMTAHSEENGRVWSLLEKLNGSVHPLLLERPVSTATLTRAVRVLLQSRIRQYQIRDQITERTRLEIELRRKVEELAESDRRKDEFLAVLGHELRNPLAAIVHGSQVLPILGTLNQKAAEVCELLGRQASQMTHLVDDLLDVSRVSRGTVRLRLERMDLVPLLRQVVEEHQTTADERGQTLETHLPESLPIDGDPTRLRQIFGNLIHNACKFSDPGGQVTVTARRGEEGKTAAIAVRDTGIGMSEEALAQLFQPFQQAETPMDRSGGLGLGLALVRGFVELHGGTVAARSSGLGRGSELTVHLPLAKGDSAAAAEASAAARPPQPTVFRILLVEDSKPVADIFSLTLRQMGHEVEVAPHAHAALKQIPVYRPQVVFSDISMPGMSGYEFAQQIRQEPQWNHLVLVAVTGYGQPEDCEQAYQAGFHYHLVKPAEIEQIETLLDRIAKLGV